MGFIIIHQPFGSNAPFIPCELETHPPTPTNPLAKPLRSSGAAAPRGSCHGLACGWAQMDQVAHGGCPWDSPWHQPQLALRQIFSHGGRVSQGFGPKNGLFPGLWSRTWLIRNTRKVPAKLLWATSPKWPMAGLAHGTWVKVAYVPTAGFPWACQPKEIPPFSEIPEFKLLWCL